MGRKMKAFAPGRTEIAGNHVDHQHGLAVTSALKQGISAKIEFNNTNLIKIESEGFEPFTVDLDEVTNKPFNTERFTSKALVAGVAYCFIQRGYKLSGFDAKIKSDIPSGMGLSSSAAFELLIGVILNEAFANGEVTKMELAQIGQFAEDKYYGKPCGLLDQTAISYGGVIKIDFRDPENLNVKPIDFSFDFAPIDAVLVDSGVEHGDISDMYAAIPEDMRNIANICGANYLGELNIHDFMPHIKEAKEKYGAGAVLRAMHFFFEQDLVYKRIEALQKYDITSFCYLHEMSGKSSATYLKNVSIGETNQDAMVCLSICDVALDIACHNKTYERGGARIHGGGFGGCIQNFMPKGQKESFIPYVDAVYGKKVCQEIDFSDIGA